VYLLGERRLGRLATGGVRHDGPVGRSWAGIERTMKPRGTAFCSSRPREALGGGPSTRVRAQREVGLFEREVADRRRLDAGCEAPLAVDLPLSP
jgi:hypothetical protein